MSPNWSTVDLALKRIETRFDHELSALVVNFPDPITLDQLRTWKAEFLTALVAKEPDCANLLLDTNQHNFENMACLQFLREMLTNEPDVLRILKRVAFVAPATVRSPCVVSEAEAYFSTYADAHSALKKPSFFGEEQKA